MLGRRVAARRGCWTSDVAVAFNAAVRVGRGNCLGVRDAVTWPPGPGSRPVKLALDARDVIRVKRRHACSRGYFHRVALSSRTVHAGRVSRECFGVRLPRNRRVSIRRSYVH